MKVVFFNGSPRGRQSNTHRIAAEILAGAQAAGAITEEVFLVEKHVEHCRGCFSCWHKTPGQCVIKDDVNQLIDLFLESDFAGMGTPIYGMYMTGLLKNFLDRFLPMATPHIQKAADGTFYHNGRVAKYPKQFFVANAGFPGERNFDLLRAVISQQPMALQVYRNCGEALNNRPDERLSEPIQKFYEALYAAGGEMVRQGQVSEATHRRIQMEIISDEDYMAQANKHWDEAIHQAELAGEKEAH